MQYIDKDLSSIQETRNLLENAQQAFLMLNQYSADELDKISSAVMRELSLNISRFATELTDESAVGCPEAETQLCTQFLKAFKEKIQGQKYVGLLEGSVQAREMSVGMPLGVLGVILPETTTLALLANIVLITIKSGNTVVFLPNEKSKESVFRIIDEMSKMAADAHLPTGAIACVSTVTSLAVQEMMNNPYTALILDVGRPEYAHGNDKNSKPFIYGGVGSSPVFIEHSADLEKAAQDVVESRAFNHGILPAAEQFLVVENSVVEEVKTFMKKYGAYFMNNEEEKRLLAFIKVSKDWKVNNYVGKTALWLAEKAQINVPAGTLVLVSLQDYMCEDSVYNEELACPLIAFYQEPDWLHACEKCLNILREEKMGHTLTIHSRNEQVIREFVLKKPVGRVIVNAPTVFAATGLVSNLPPSMLLGGISTGRGQSAGNITPKDLTYVKNAGFASEDSGSNDSHASQDTLNKVLELFV
ncbi:aldehyde dehydrogenase family protein [Lactovum odontotermitis]